MIRRPWSNDDTQVIPPVTATPPPGRPAAPDHTMVIPATPPRGPSASAHENTVVLPGGAADRDATQVIPTVRPDRAGAGPGAGEAPPDRPRPVRRKDDTGFMLLGRVRAYDSKPGDVGYRGRHSDIVPLAEASRVRKVIHGIGEVMITFGLVLLLFAGYEIWGKAAIVEGHQNDLDKQLEQAWADEPVVVPPAVDPSASASPTQAAPPPIPPGSSLGRLYLPRLSKYWVVVEGIEPKDIAYAPGHYPDTARPGEIGNFSVAGHRSPAIFWDLDKMRAGDPVVVETQSTFFIYRVTELTIVAPTAIEVVAPVPGQPGVTPTEAMLTLTTCNPKWDNYQRLIMHAQLERSQPRSAGRPAEIGG
jgi:sortase A